MRCFVRPHSGGDSHAARLVRSAHGRWLALVLVLAGNAGAADAPQIRPSSIQVGAGGAVTFQFEAGAEGAGGFQVETATALGGGWNVESQAPVTELMPGLYEVSIPWSTERPASFYRVLSWGVAARLYLNEAMSSNVSGLADAEGRFWDWIEIYNPGDTAVDLTGYGLSDDPELPLRWKFPGVLIQPGDFLVVFASDLDLAEPGNELHTNFRLDADGERLWLTGPGGQTVDDVQLPAMATDQSAGRAPDGGDLWHVYAKEQTTPGAPNASVSIGLVIRPPRFVEEQRFFPAGSVVNVVLESDSPGHVIRYTTNGSPVTAGSPGYTGPLEVTRTTVVRAMAFEGDRSSVGVARTYFVGVSHELPILSLAAPAGNFDFRDGYLYGLGSSVLGSGGQVLQTFPFYGSHAWADREIAVSVEFYEPDRSLGFELQAGLQIFGGWGSRGYPQKSFALFARQQYGQGKIEHQIFPDKPIDEFESLVLRNSGNDNQSTHQTPPRPPIVEFGPTYSYGSYFVNSSFTLMRDAMMQRLLAGLGLDTQAYRPAVLYINGEYWGIYNIREKINEHYIIANHGLAEGEFDLIEGYGSVMAGDNTVNQQMRSFVAGRDLQSDGSYSHVVDNYIEVDNFIDYHLAVIYFQNFDIGNIKSWRPRVPRGRFRWIVYDQDYGFNLWDPEIYVPAMARDYGDYDNMFSFYTAGTGTGTGWPNEGGRTLLLRKMLTNAGFKAQFIKRCADLLNGPFREERVEQSIQEMAAVIRPEIPRHLERWSWARLQALGFARPHQEEYEPFTQETWESNLEVLLEFARNRPAKLRQDCQDHFGLSGGLAEVTVGVEPAGAAQIQFNTLKLGAFPWHGVCFRDYPVNLVAIPRPGYRFVGWVGGDDRPARELELNEPQLTVVAQFETTAAIPPAQPVVIVTEIQYHPSAEAESGDWIELRNRGDQPVDLSGWILRDDDDEHAFLVPELTLPPGSFVVLCQDKDRFDRHYPGGTNVVGDFVFGLGNGGDIIRLFSSAGEPMLQFEYSDNEPWPVEPDGTGYTLRLKDPEVFSTNAVDWTSSTTQGGTPGLPGL